MTVRARAIAVVAALVVGVSAVIVAVFAVRGAEVAKSSPRDVVSSAPVATAPALEKEVAPPPTSSNGLAMAPVGSAEPPPDNEATLMAYVRRAQTDDAELALQLARLGNQMFPESAGAPERAAIIIHALAKLGRPSEARGEAEQMVNDYPDSPWSAEIEAFTGAHPHRNR